MAISLGTGDVMLNEFFKVWSRCSKELWYEYSEKFCDCFSEGVLYKQLESNKAGDYLSVSVSVDGDEYYPCLLMVMGRDGYDDVHYCHYDNCAHFAIVGESMKQLKKAGEL